MGALSVGGAVQFPPDALERGSQGSQPGAETGSRVRTAGWVVRPRVWAWGWKGCRGGGGAVTVIPLDVLRFDTILSLEELLLCSLQDVTPG